MERVSLIQEEERNILEIGEPVVLVDGGERHVLKVGESEFIYRRLAFGDVEEVAAQIAEYDSMAVSSALAERAVLGWRDLEGDPPFLPERVHALPRRVKELLSERWSSNVPPGCGAAVHAATIVYRRFPDARREMALRRYVRRGLVQTHRVLGEMLRYMVLGWDGVAWLDGTAAEWDEGLVARLPLNAYHALAEAADSEFRRADKDPRGFPAQLKNSNALLS